jgi:histidinol phosphatase-like PHP family hydrolase
MKELKTRSFISHKKTYLFMIINNPKTSDYHVHTSDWSDGSDTYQDMIKKAREIGLETIAIADHSSAIEPGLIKLDRQGKNTDRNEVNSWRNYKGISVLAGVEGDLLDEHGNVCFEIMGQIPEFCTVSLHGLAYRGDSTKITEGFIKAIEKYKNIIDCITHPYDKTQNPLDPTKIPVDLVRLVKCANHYRIPVEVNCKSISRETADMDGVMYVLNNADRIMVNTDAHSVDELERYRNEGIEFLKDRGYLEE